MSGEEHAGSSRSPRTPPTARGSHSCTRSAPRARPSRRSRPCTRSCRGSPPGSSRTTPARHPESWHPGDPRPRATRSRPRCETHPPSDTPAAPAGTPAEAPCASRRRARPAPRRKKPRAEATQAEAEAQQPKAPRAQSPPLARGGARRSRASPARRHGARTGQRLARSSRVPAAVRVEGRPAHGARPYSPPRADATTHTPGERSACAWVCGAASETKCVGGRQPSTLVATGQGLSASSTDIEWHREAAIRLTGEIAGRIARDVGGLEPTTTPPLWPRLALDTLAPCSGDIECEGIASLPRKVLLPAQRS